MEKYRAALFFKDGTMEKFEGRDKAAIHRAVGQSTEHWKKENTAHAYIVIRSRDEKRGTVSAIYQWIPTLNEFLKVKDVEVTSLAVGGPEMLYYQTGHVFG